MMNRLKSVMKTIWDVEHRCCGADKMQSRAKPMAHVNGCFQLRILCFRGTHLTLIAFCVLAALPSRAQTLPWSERVANAAIQGRSNDQLVTAKPSQWSVETGILLEGMDAAWYNTANGDYFRYVKDTVDGYLKAGGPEADESEMTKPMAAALLGRQLLLLYGVTLDPKYFQAARHLRQKLILSCGAASSEPKQAGDEELENPCMTEAFQAECASAFQEPQDLAGVTKQLLQWGKGMGLSPARRTNDALTDSQVLNLAWYATTLVDSLPYYPRDDPERAQLIAMLNRTAAEIALRQNRATGLWVETSAPNAKLQEPFESTTDCLFAYALWKGVRQGYLPTRFSAGAERAWHGILRQFAATYGNGAITPASVERKGVGAFLVAATEADLAPTAKMGHGVTVLLDAWYNSQQRRNAAGQMGYFHYKWSDFSDSGYSHFGQTLRSYGMQTDTLNSAPTAKRLRAAQIYIIVSPDIPAKNPAPHYMTDQEADAIAGWVKQGGILVIMENDPPNADLAHMNLLSDRFGIHFDDVLAHHIIGEQIGPGRIITAGDGPLFHQPHTLYMKDTCTISLKRPAATLLRDSAGIVMAAAKYGSGTVFANVDPWLYNEYTDGRNDPKIYSQFDNLAGGKELVRWLLEQRPKKGEAVTTR